MPNISITTSEVNSSVLRPVVLDIVNQIIDITKISKDIPIFFPGSTEAVPQKGATMSDQNKNERDNTRLDFQSNVTIQVNEVYPEDRVLSTTTAADDNTPVFLDEALGVLIRPAYIPTDISITFQFTDNNQTSIERWRDDIRMRISKGRDMNIHSVSYHYPIPPKFVDILKDIYAKRENVDGYGDTFNSYLATHSSPKMTVVSNENGAITLLAVAETQGRILGIFDFSTAPEKANKKENSSTYTASFTYNFRLDKPTECNMRYPVMVHNQFLNPRSIPPDNAPNLDNQNLAWSWALSALRPFENGTLATNPSRKAPIILPSIDEFIPKSVLPYTKTLLVALCAVDTTDPTLAINLKELGDFIIDPDILAFIQATEYSWITKPLYSIIQCSLYRGMDLLSYTLTTSNSALDIRSTENLPIRINNRMRLSIVNDLGMLSDAALARLKASPIAARKLLTAISVNRYDLELLKPRCDFTKIMNHLPHIAVPNLRNLRYALPRTVEISSIIAKKLPVTV